MGAQARQNCRGNEILQLHGKITHQEKLRDARDTNKHTKVYLQTSKTNRQTTDGQYPPPPPPPDADGAAIGATRCSMNRKDPERHKSFTHRTSHRCGWPKGFGALNSSPHSRIFTSVSVSFRPRPYLFTSATGRNRCAHRTNYIWHNTYPICDAPLSRSARRSFAPSQN